MYKRQKLNKYSVRIKIILLLAIVNNSHEFSQKNKSYPLDIYLYNLRNHSRSSFSRVFAETPTHF
jgi:hypothetical protein